MPPATAIYVLSLFASEIYGYHWCTIFLFEIMLRISCHRIQAETFAEHFPDNAPHADVLIGYYALFENVRIARAIPAI